MLEVTSKNIITSKWNTVLHSQVIASNPDLHALLRMSWRQLVQLMRQWKVWFCIHLAVAPTSASASASTSALTSRPHRPISTKVLQNILTFSPGVMTQVMFFKTSGSPSLYFRSNSLKVMFPSWGHSFGGRLSGIIQSSFKRKANKNEPV